ncbi:esterase AAEL000016-like isoform X1 [Hibiscus syriacus]|uniref:esterase AAEL000016-like isoform X1 n=1 Tax=Hibiscus syriacus TaxID=106335 RepID=UPI00192345C2|nr:esterase AAEL000016-like isoform X1 [Hibiscus syriacus]
MGSQMLRKPRVVCLHGFRTSAEILKKQVLRWPLTVLDKLDLVFLDAPFPAQGKSDVEAFFDPPYYEWFQANQNFTEYTNFEECLEYIENYMIKNGPFDGFLGFSQVGLICLNYLREENLRNSTLVLKMDLICIFFGDESQGAVLSAALPGMQRDGLALTRIPKIKFLILISGAKFGWSKFGHHKLSCKAFSTPLECPSLHITGEMDFMKPESTALLESFVDPFVINHPKGHTVPRLDERSTEVMLEFIERIKKTTATDDEQNRSA